MNLEGCPVEAPYASSASTTANKRSRWWKRYRRVLRYRRCGVQTQRFSGLRRIWSTPKAEGRVDGGRCQSSNPTIDQHQQPEKVFESVEEEQLPFATGDEDVDGTCCICREGDLSSYTKAAAVDGCPHLFCFECIDEWASRENTCPLCKARFSCIFHLDAGKGTSPTRARLMRKHVESRNQAPTTRLELLHLDLSFHSDADSFIEGESEEQHLGVDEASALVISNSGGLAMGGGETNEISMMVFNQPSLISISPNPNLLLEQTVEAGEDLSFVHMLDDGTSGNISELSFVSSTESHADDESHADSESLKYTSLISSIIYISDIEDEHTEDNYV